MSCISLLFHHHSWNTSFSLSSFKNKIECHLKFTSLLQGGWFVSKTIRHYYLLGTVLGGIVGSGYSKTWAQSVSTQCRRKSPVNVQNVGIIGVWAVGAVHSAKG